MARKKVRNVFQDLYPEDQAAEMEMRSLLLQGLGPDVLESLDLGHPPIQHHRLAVLPDARDGATALDAVKAGYKVTVIEGLSKGVAPDTTAKALEEMTQKGVTIKKEL